MDTLQVSIFCGSVVSDWIRNAYNNRHKDQSSVAEPVCFWPAPGTGNFFTGSGSYKKVYFQPLIFFYNIPPSLKEKIIFY